MSVSRRVCLAAVLAVVIVGGVGLLWPSSPPADPGIKVWDASDGKPEPK